MVSEPERVELARTPTPLRLLERTSAELGVELWVKRDDLTGSGLSGNKVRKLEFLMADARTQEADTVITCGGEQSNHCRATALVCAQLGLRCILLLRTQDPSSPPTVVGNILLDRLAGAEIRWISHAEYARRYDLFEQIATEVQNDGGRPYVVVEGGSSAVGCWGYVRGGRELEQDLSRLEPKMTTVVYACGSGGTGAGLVLAKKLRLLSPRAVGINVCDSREYFVETIGRLGREFDERYGTGARISDDDIEICDGYVGRGYAKSRPEEIEAVVGLSKREGIVLDPVYTGKAWYGLCEELAKTPGQFGERVVFLHTGGIFGTLAAASSFSGF